MIDRTIVTIAQVHWKLGPSHSIVIPPLGGPTTSFRLTRHAGQSGHLVLGMGNLWQFTMILWQVEKIGNDESLHFFLTLISCVWRHADFKGLEKPRFQGLDTAQS